MQFDRFQMPETFSLICKLSCNLHQILILTVDEVMKSQRLSQGYERAVRVQENSERKDKLGRSNLDN